MFSLLIFIIILSIMILAHEYGHFAQARRLGIRVESFSLGFGPKLFAYKKGFTEYKLCLFAFGGYVKLAGDSPSEKKGEPYEFLSRRPLDRAKVIFAGPLLNYIFAFFCFWLVNMIGYPNLTAKVGEVMAGYPAAKSGVLKGDVITAVDGKDVRFWQDVRDNIYKRKPSKVQIDILRGPQKISLSVELRQETVRNIFGKQEKVSMIGIRPLGESVLTRHNIFEGFVLAGKRLWDMTVITYSAIFQMLTGSMSVRDSVTGPLGMFYITSEALSLGISALLHLMAVLSASLAIFNLLPFPVLDGGHLFFLFIEKLRGKPLSPKAEEIINQAAIAAIIGVAILVFLNDLSRFGVWDKLLGLLGRLNLFK